MISGVQRSVDLRQRKVSSTKNIKSVSTGYLINPQGTNPVPPPFPGRCHHFYRGVFTGHVRENVSRKSVYQNRLDVLSTRQRVKYLLFRLRVVPFRKTGFQWVPRDSKKLSLRHTEGQ